MTELKGLPAERPLPAAAARQLLLERHVTAPAAGRAAWRKVSVRTTAAAAGASVVLVGSSAAAYVTFREPSTPVADLTRCYSVASLDGGDDFSGTSVSQAFTGDGERDAIGAVEACSTLWRVGMLRPGERGVGEPQADANLPVPPLAACTLDNGIAAVFPGDESVCAELGIPRLSE